MRQDLKLYQHNIINTSGVLCDCMKEVLDLTRDMITDPKIKLLNQRAPIRIIRNQLSNCKKLQKLFMNYADNSDKFVLERKNTLIKSKINIKDKSK